MTTPVFYMFFSETRSHLPILETTEEQTGSDLTIAPTKRILESSQEAQSPALQRDSTFASVKAEQSNTGVISTQNLLQIGPGAELSLEEEGNMKEAAEGHSRDEESCNPGQKNGRVTKETDTGNHIIAAENETSEESDVAMPLNHSMDDEGEAAPHNSVLTTSSHPGIPPFQGDLRREMNHHGGLVGSKMMKRSSSLISDSGIESEPSSVAWPVEVALRARPSLDFSSEREIPKQIVCQHLVHRSCLEGLQMESNSSLPSGGIQASLTSISSLPYEEDRQQRQLSKLTKSVSAPQISSPEDDEDDHVLLKQDTDRRNSVRHQDSSRITCNLDSGLSGLSQDEKSRKYNISSEKSDSLQFVSETCRVKSVLKVSLIQSPDVKESAASGSQEEGTTSQTHTSEDGTSAEDVHLVGLEEAPCAHESVAEKEDECQMFHQSKLQGAKVEGSSQTSLKPQPSSDLLMGAPTRRKPSDLTGLTPLDITSAVVLSGASSSDQEPLECQTKSSKIPSSGLAFVNKKMVEVVNMSVSCAPTCLPFSSVLRDSPSISGMSARQATSPITHQPLGSFGIISSSSLSPLNMDDETNERMLK